MQRTRSAGTPATPHRCCPPQHVPLRRRSVYGLVSGTVLPGRLPTPKRSGIVTRLLLTYRCGGSAGLAFVGFTGFPFHLCDREVYKHLNAALVCRPSSAASTGSQSTTEWISWAAIARCRCSCNSTRLLRLRSGDRDMKLARLVKVSLRPVVATARTGGCESFLHGQ